MTVYWMVWDAAAHWIVDRLEREGSLAAVRRIRSAGVRAAARPPSPNCQTPSSLATLFTGTSSTEHGVTGFHVPGGVDDPVELQRSGFDPSFPARPPVWRAAQEQGLRVAFVHTPWVFGEGPDIGPGVQAAVYAYGDRRADAGMLQLHDQAPGERLAWAVGEMTVQVTVTASGATLATQLQTVQVAAADGWIPVRLSAPVVTTGTSTAGAGFWVRLITGPDGPALVRTGTWVPRIAGEDTALVRSLAHAQPFAGDGLKSLYRSGRLGPRLVDRGDGGPEEVFVSSLECVARSFMDATDAVLATRDADLVVVYLPFTDDVGHEMAGWCDTASRAHRPEIAAAVWRDVRRCYGWADAVLGRVLDRADDTDTVLLCADHGILGGSHLVAVNEALLSAGLAAVDDQGRLDPSRSQVIYHPANNGLLRVNHDDLPGGLVPRARSGERLAAAMRTLLEVEAPASQHAPGGAVVARFVDGLGRGLSPERVNPRDDAAYVVLKDDYQPTARLDGGQPVRAMPKSAAHTVNTGSDRLHATFAAAGPGLRPGADLGVIDNTYVAGLVLDALGVTRAGAPSKRDPEASAVGGSR